MKLARIKDSLSWKQVESGSFELLKKGDKVFRPDILLMTSGPGAIVASLAMIQLRRFLPVYTAILEDKRGTLFQHPPKGHIEISTSKWNMYLPEQLSDETDKRIMIIDDCVMLGDVHTALREYLQETGFLRENIFFATLVCSQLAIDSSKAPDLYSFINPHKDLFFPWGRWF